MVQVDAAAATSDVGAVEVNDTALSALGAVSVGEVAGAAAVTSDDDASEKDDAKALVPLTTPTDSVAAVEAASAQVFAPLLARVTTTTAPSLGSEALAVQVEENVEGPVSVTVGVVLTVVKPGGNVSVTVAPLASAPVADVVNPQVHVAAADPTVLVGAVEVTDTADGDVGVRVSTDVAVTAVRSTEVATVKLGPPYAPAGPLSTARLNVPAVEEGSEHPLPLSVTTTTLALVASDAVAVHDENPLIRLTAGLVLAVVKPAGKVAVTVPADPSAPLDDDVKPTVQVEGALATSEVGAVPEKVTALGDEAPAGPTPTTATPRSASATATGPSRSARRRARDPATQLVQASVAGDVVGVPAPPLATIPVNDGIER
jgi:hypothetical protein